MNAKSNSPAGLRWRNGLAAALCLFSCTAMLGDLIGSRTLKGLGVASAAAPCPKVFCAIQGMEGFACEFTLLYEAGGKTHALPITPELYARLAGPYNRRNVYGAALAAGPILPQPLWEAVFHYAFAAEGPLRKEFGLPREAVNIRVVVRSKTHGQPQVWVLPPQSTP